MASVHCYFLLFSLLVSFLFINHVSGDDQTQQRIDHICRQMEEYGFCNKTFNQNLKAPSTDIVGLAQITIELAIDNSTTIHYVITRLLQNVTDVPTRNALTECEHAYEVVTEYFNKALAYFGEKDYSSMVDSERLTPRAQASCDTTFNTPPNPPNPLVEMNREMRILIAMAIVTGHELAS